MPSASQAGTQRPARHKGSSPSGTDHQEPPCSSRMNSPPRNCLPPTAPRPCPRRSHPRRAGAHRALGTQPESHLRAGSRRRAGRRPRIRGALAEGRAVVGRRLHAGRRARHHQGKHRHARRAGAAGHRGHRPDAGQRRRAAGGPHARGRRRGAGQDHHAGLRHAVVRPVQLPRADPQSLGPGQEPRRLQRRRRRGRGRLRPAAHRHRHRRLGAPAGRLVRHRHAQAQPGPHSHRPALHGPLRRSHDAHRDRYRADDGRAVTARRARPHEPALPGHRLARPGHGPARRAHRPAAGRRLRPARGSRRSWTPCRPPRACSRRPAPSSNP